MAGRGQGRRRRGGGPVQLPIRPRQNASQRDEVAEAAANLEIMRGGGDVDDEALVKVGDMFGNPWHCKLAV